MTERCPHCGRLIDEDLGDFTDPPLPAVTKPKTAPNGWPPKKMVEAYNMMAAEFDLPTCSRISDKRRRSLMLVEEDWIECLRAVAASGFCLGENDRGWRASIDFLCQPSSRLKLVENFYTASPRRNGASISYDRVFSKLLEGRT